MSNKLMVKKKNLDLGKYPSVHFILKMKQETKHLSECLKKEIFLFFNTRKGIKKIKLYK